MAYGTIKVDTVTFTNDGVDKSVTLSGLVQNPTFSGNVTVTGTLSGVTVTGTTANFTSGNFTNISGGTHTITSGVFAAGSAASPSITFTGDLNTGIYSPGADQVAISTGGTGRLFVGSTGTSALGLNTAAGVPVAISSSTDGEQFRIRRIGGTYNPGLLVGLSDTASNEIIFNSTYSTGTAPSYVWQDAGNERMRLTGSGRLGVGTSSPSYTLQVAETSAVVSAASYSTFFGQGTRADLVLQATSSNNDQQRQVIRSNSDSLIFGTENAAVTTFTEKLRIDSSGRVGIGTSSPVAPLHVSGSGVFARLTDTQAYSFGTSGPILDFTGNDSSGASILFARLQGSPSNGNPDRGFLNILTRVNGVNTSTLQVGTGLAADVFVPNGRLGVGTTSPGSIFDVKPSASSSTLRIEAGTINSDSVRLSAGGTVNTYLEYRGYLGHAWFVDATERLRIDSSGRVGIGTSSPSDTLQINKTGAGGVKVVSTTQSTIYFSNAAGTGGYIIGRSIGSDNAHNLFSYDATNSHYVDYFEGGSGGYRSFYTNGTERLRITSAGLVGIGTSSPGNNCEIYVGTPSNNDAGITLTNGNNVGFGTSLSFSHRTTNGGAMATRSYISSEGGSGNSFLRFATTIGGTLAERVRIDEAGRVGIGTTSPSHLLDVNGDVAVGIGAANGNNYNFRVRAGTTGLSRFIAADTSDAGYIDYDHNLNNWIFRTNSSEAFRVDSSQRLLVGTSSGSGNNLLQIQGEAGSSAGIGGIVLRRGLAPSLLGSGSIMGRIDFGPNDGGVGASIIGEGDAQQGTNDYPSRLVFSTTADGASSPTERMRISSTGQAYVVSTYYGATIISTETAGTSVGLIEGKHSGTAGSITGATTSFTVWTNGNVVNTNNSYGAISDIKLKENIVDAGSQWDDIRALQIRKYNFKEGQTHTQIGLIAQEVELVSPGLVTESPDRNEDGNDLGTVTKSVNYSVLYMKAVKALQEAMERIETLEAKVAALESA